MKQIRDADPAASAGNPTQMPELEGVRHRFLDLPGLRMHVAEAGQGEPVLLLHGAIQHWWAWHRVIPGLAEQHRVLALDLRGSGWTDVPAAGYTSRQMVADIVAALDALDIEQVRLVSTDMGVLPGYALCYDHPERVRSHAAIGVPPLSMKLGVRHVKMFLPVWHQQVGAIPGLAPALFARGRQPLSRHMLEDFSAPGKAPDPEAVEHYLARLRMPGRAQAASAMMRHLVLPESMRIARGTYRRTRLTMPTLVLAGAEDHAFPPALVEDLLQTARPYVDSVEFGTVAGAAHYVADDSPDELVAHLRQFFSA